MYQMNYLKKHSNNILVLLKELSLLLMIEENQLVKVSLNSKRSHQHKNVLTNVQKDVSSLLGKDS